MNLDKLRIRKINKQEKYKIYNISTGDIIEIYDSRKLAHNALKDMLDNKKKVRFNENDNVVIVHIKDGDSIKQKIKEEIKK